MYYKQFSKHGFFISLLLFISLRSIIFGSFRKKK